MALKLHKTLGVNPHILVCVQCGEDSGVLMLGNSNYVAKCKEHGNVLVTEGARKCSTTGCGEPITDKRELGPRESIPMGLCAKCTKLRADADAAVSDGGIYWRCKVCGSEGAIRLNDNTRPLIEDVRGRGAMGIEFKGGEECPSCRRQGEGGRR